VLYPPSLPSSFQSRTFRASNGELGVHPKDATAFLDACQTDQVRVLGWDLWLVDHRWDAATNAPQPAKGQWCGAIPVRDECLPCILGGSENLEAARDQIAALDLAELVETKWRGYLRYNFTIEQAGSDVLDE
jgi:hypothetical protein